MKASQRGTNVHQPPRDAAIALPMMDEQTTTGLMRSSSLVLFLAGISMLVPLVVEASLPAIPAMAAAMNATDGAIALSFTSLLIGLALGQFVGGYCCDRYGRRPVLLVGLAVFVAAGFGASLTSDTTSLVWWRALQGLGASIGVVVAKSVPRDMWHGSEITARLSFITSFSTLAMLLGPAIGSALLGLLSWRAVFALFPLLGFATLALSMAGFKETLEPERRTKTPFWLQQRDVLGNMTASFFFAANACFFAAMMAFATSSPTILLGRMGLDLMTFGWLYGAAIGCITLGSLTNGVLARRTAPRLRLGIGIMLAYLGLGVLVSQIWAPSPWLFLLGGGFFALSCGFNYPNAQAAGLAHARTATATAAGVIGTMAFLAGAISSAIATLMHSDAIVGFVSTMSIFCLAGTVLILVAARRAEEIVKW